MLSRGFDGNLPTLVTDTVTKQHWISALSVPVLALIFSLLFLVIGW
jgi:hypothetical protein